MTLADLGIDDEPDPLLETEKQARILWLCYPNAPTGADAPEGFFGKAAAWGRERDVIVVNDAAYVDLYYDEPPRSLLEHGPAGVVEFHSMSKRSAMTGSRPSARSRPTSTRARRRSSRTRPWPASRTSRTSR